MSSKINQIDTNNENNVFNSTRNIHTITVVIDEGKKREKKWHIEKQRTNQPQNTIKLFRLKLFVIVIS